VRGGKKTLLEGQKEGVSGKKLFKRRKSRTTELTWEHKRSSSLQKFFGFSSNWGHDLF
jgi:hypothetical protein